MMGVNMIPSVIPALYNVQTSNSAFEYFLGLEGTDVEGWNVYKDTGISAYADFDRGFPKTFQHFNYTRKFKLLQDYIEDGTLNNAAAVALRGMGISAAQKRETDAASTFIYAFTASAPYLGPDAVALCSATHPFSASNAATYDNTGTEAFSYQALTNARQNLRNLADGVGNPLMRNGTLVLHPIELQKPVDEVLGASGKPGTGDNDGSSARGFTGLAWDFLTNATDWWLIDPVWAKQSLFWFNRVPLGAPMIVEQATTHVVYEFRMRYSWGFIDPRFVYGNDVA
jgi:hypothetical protein